MEVSKTEKIDYCDRHTKAELVDRIMDKHWKFEEDPNLARVYDDCRCLMSGTDGEFTFLLALHEYYDFKLPRKFVWWWLFRHMDDADVKSGWWERFYVDDDPYSDKWKVEDANLR